ncbi:hypothetical protein [Actinophytocola sediminis]
MPLTQEEIDEIIRKINEGFETFKSEFQKFVQGVEGWVKKWVPWAYGKLTELLSWMYAKLMEVEAELRKFLTQPGQPWTLWNTGSTWTNSVGTVSGMEGNFTESAMPTGAEWDGTAASQYKRSLGPQGKALAAVKAATDAVDDALGKLAVAIGVAWLAIAAAIVSFISEIIAEAGATVASEGAATPATVPAAGISVAKVAGLVAAAIGVLEAFVASTVLPAFKDLDQVIQTNGAYPKNLSSGENEWPRMTSDVSDSSHRGNHGKNAPWEMSKA